MPAGSYPECREAEQERRDRSAGSAKWALRGEMACRQKRSQIGFEHTSSRRAEACN